MINTLNRWGKEFLSQLYLFVQLKIKQSKHWILCNLRESHTWSNKLDWTDRCTFNVQSSFKAKRSNRKLFIILSEFFCFRRKPNTKWTKNREMTATVYISGNTDTENNSKWIIINFQLRVKSYEWLIKCISARNKNKEADEKKNNETKKIFTWKLESYSQTRSTTLISI